jgi:hypothetical protein
MSGRLKGFVTNFPYKRSTAKLDQGSWIIFRAFINVAFFHDMLVLFRFAFHMCNICFVISSCGHRGFVLVQVSFTVVRIDANYALIGQLRSCLCTVFVQNLLTILITYLTRSFSVLFFQFESLSCYHFA